MLRPNVVRFGKKKQGRGFSHKELETAGLTYHQAGLLGISVDKKRDTVHEENVRVLKFLKEEATKSAKKGG